MFFSLCFQGSKEISLQCTENKVSRGRRKAEFSHCKLFFTFSRREMTSKQQRGEWKSLYGREVQGGKMVTGEVIACAIHKS